MTSGPTLFQVGALFAVRSEVDLKTPFQPCKLKLLALIGRFTVSYKLETAWKDVVEA